MTYDCELIKIYYTQARIKLLIMAVWPLSHLCCICSNARLQSGRSDAAVLASKGIASLKNGPNLVSRASRSSCCDSAHSNRQSNQDAC